MPDLPLQDISHYSTDDLQNRVETIIDPNTSREFQKEFFNAFLFPKRIEKKAGINRLVHVYESYLEIDRKLAICYPTLETTKGIQIMRHRFPTLRNNLKISIITGFRIKPEHGFYHLKEEVLYQEKKKAFYVSPGELKTESEIIDFLTDLFDRLNK